MLISWFFRRLTGGLDGAAFEEGTAMLTTGF
jgi:hypothetical protein